MNDNTKSKEPLVVGKQASINANKNSNSGSPEHNTGAVIDDIVYSATPQTAIWVLYVFLFQCQT